MALLDLSLVTQTLVDLIRTYASASDAWPALTTLTVDPRPPDKLTGDNTLGFYLYHTTEETTGKNTYIPGVSDSPIRFNPMGLNLYYLLTAHSDIDDANSAYREQLMMGLAMKALHDHPAVTDDTQVFDSALNTLRPVMHPLLRGAQNGFRIAMQPTKPEEANDYWTAGSSPLRFSAYYHVAVVKLEPEDPMIRAGRVLTYNVFVMPLDAPRADTTASVMSYLLPGEAAPRSLDIRPAQVTYDGEFRVIGSAFTGDRVDLMIRLRDWEAARVVDAGWDAVATASQITATVRQTLDGDTIAPGIYGASVRVERTRIVPSGTKTLTSVSNETPLIIAPRVDAISPPDPQGEFTVTGAVYQHPEIEPGAVMIFVGPDRLGEGDPLDLDPGQFAVVSDTEIAVRLPAGLTPGEAVSFRLIVNGAESAPLWVTP